MGSGHDPDYAFERGSLKLIPCFHRVFFFFMNFYIKCRLIQEMCPLSHTNHLYFRIGVKIERGTKLCPAVSKYFCGAARSYMKRCMYGKTRLTGRLDLRARPEKITSGVGNSGNQPYTTSGLAVGHIYVSITICILPS